MIISYCQFEGKQIFVIFVGTVVSPYKAPPTKDSPVYQAPPTKDNPFYQAPPTKDSPFYQAPPTKDSPFYQAPPIEGLTINEKSYELKTIQPA